MKQNQFCRSFHAQLSFGFANYWLIAAVTIDGMSNRAKKNQVSLPLTNFLSNLSKIRPEHVLTTFQFARDSLRTKQALKVTREVLHVRRLDNDLT